jgi:hypothetical protein
MSDWWSADPIATPQAAPAEAAGAFWEQDPIAEQKVDKSYKGGFLPFSRDAEGNVGFDSDAGIVGMVKRGVTLPGDVMSGKTQMYDDSGRISDEVVGRSFDLAQTVTPTLRTPQRYPKAAPQLQPQQAPSALIGASERIGVDLPRVAASDSMTVQRAGQALANVPFVGNPIKKASEKAIDQIGDAAVRTSEGFAKAGTPTNSQAGGVLSQGIENYIGPVTSARGKKLYDEVGKHVREDVTAPLTATAAKVAEIEAERGAAKLGPGAVTKLVEEAVATLTPKEAPHQALARQVFGGSAPQEQRQGLTYAGVKKLRERVGEMLKGGPLPGDISQKELKAIYGSLSDDLRNVVQTAGGEKALAAFERANKYHRLVSERRENLARILKAPSEEAMLEKVLASSQSSSRADIALLMQARKALPRDEWDEIASTAISRLGKDNAGEFSPVRFVSDYAKISPAGKQVLFNSTGKRDLAKALDDIATVSGRFKELQKFANPSGTAAPVLGGGLVAAAIAAPITTAGTVLGGAVMARVLASPATARSMAQWSKAYEMAVTRPSKATINALEASSRRFGFIIGENLGLQAYSTQMGAALKAAAEANSAGPVAPEDANKV